MIILSAFRHFQVFSPRPNRMEQKLVSYLK